MSNFDMMRTTSRKHRALRPSVILCGLLLSALLLPALAQAQDRSALPDFLFQSQYWGSRDNEKKNIHDGNQIAISFFNTGLWAGVGETRGNWPKGSRDFYIGDVVPVIVAEVPVDLDGDSRPDTNVVKALTPRHPRSGSNNNPENPSIFWGLEAMAGFASNENDNESPAISTSPETWPDRWPDQPTWIDAETGGADWNGFFGRDIFNADLESYYWADDHSDKEMQSRYPGFHPDSTNTSRDGLGLAVKVRALQWTQFLAQDALFMIYEVTNTGTTTYPRVAVGMTAGTLAGGDGDSQDDLAFFDQLNRIVYSYDSPPFTGNEGQNVGIVGYAFMESPGNALDGIDNDGDGDPLEEPGRDIDGFPYVSDGTEGTGNVFTPQDFQLRVLQAGDPLILIDPVTFERSIAYVPADGSPVTVTSQGIEYTVGAGSMLEENTVIIRSQIGSQAVVEKDLVDNDLDGLIDEDEQLHFLRRKQNFQGQIEELPAVRYQNWVGFARDIRNRTATRQDSLVNGLLNRMIDEDNRDGIDNDGDWDVFTDDVGADGRAGTGDAGEGDGVPSLGEPNFEGLDVTETDQVGLSSFFYFTPPGAVRMNDDARLWEALTPGFFTTNEELVQQQSQGGVDGDFIYGSGYFRLEPGQTHRFSMALVFGNGEDFAQKLATITNNVITVQEIYDRNYNFARPPDKPLLQAVPGDGRVTLFWDAKAESSVDPILGQDFEGYRIYKSTDPFFRDPRPVTDVFGNPAILAPIAQFDLKNGRQGLWTGDYSVQQRVRGVPFYLGEDTGLKHSFVDTDVENGRTYYYAVTAYDHGSPVFFPAENSRTATVTEDGTVRTDKNVVEVVPNAPVAGFFPGGINQDVVHVQGPATGEVFVEVLDPRMLQDGNEYTLRFNANTVNANAFSVAANGFDVVENAALIEAEGVVFDGLRLIFNNDTNRLDYDRIGFTDPTDKVEMFVDRANVTSWRYTGEMVPYDYEVRFSDQTVGQSIGGFRLGSRGPNAGAGPANFEVWNTTLDRAASFVFYEVAPNGVFDTTTDFIFIYETLNGTSQPTFAIRAQAGAGTFPRGGDVYTVATRKPFSGADVFRFSTFASGVDDEDAQSQLARIKVVPNPYVAAASWERPLPPTITSGRGERRVDFIHVPRDARIRIYSSRGELVRELRHDGFIDDGTVSWDLQSRSGLDVAYGVYFYHVEVPGLGETTGKLALIK
jgi:hypothetical protein